MQRNPPHNADNFEDADKPFVNPGYALMQLSKALTTRDEHPDPATRERAQQRAKDWTNVFNKILNGTLSIGSRTPLADTPSWVTVRVLTGGFATGELLAGGPLQAHEQALIRRLLHPAELSSASGDDARRMLNSYYLTDEGLAESQRLLHSGSYDVNIPEEGALLVVAWLVQNGHAELARDLLETIGPWFSRLRFYPVPTQQPRPGGGTSAGSARNVKVFVQDVAGTIEQLGKVKPNPHILAQEEAVCVWTPLYDRMVSLFLETVEGELPSLSCDAEGRWARSESGSFPVQGGWPCQSYPDDWVGRAAALLDKYDTLRAKHMLTGRPERTKDSFAQLREYLRQCVRDPSSLQGRDVGRIRLILARYITKRGTPDSLRCRELRDRQFRHASAPTFWQITNVLVPRLGTYPPNDGVEDVDLLTLPVSEEESERWNVPAGTLVPASLRQKVERCLTDTLEMLVQRGLVTSGSTVARVLPQISAGVGAASFTDPQLRFLYSAIYSAFRRRRSLLLLNLQKQVQIEELPWVGAVERFRVNALSTKELARQTLEEVVLLTIAWFPYAILPNKLLQELRALAKTAELDLPLVDELAADIFMGEFTGKYVEAAKQAADMLENTLYATYYGIDYRQIREMKVPVPDKQEKAGWFRNPSPRQFSAFARLCAARAGLSEGEMGTWHPATNGMIIEQQQILTSQNLAVLLANLGLGAVLAEPMIAMTRTCFAWVCQRLQVKANNYHTRLIHTKNSAYAWRQMIFYLSLLPQSEVADFLSWAEKHLDKQSEAFQTSFEPATRGLILAAEGHSLDGDIAKQQGARRFLGWSKTGHWLLKVEST